MKPVLWMKLPAARATLAAHLDQVAGRFAARGWRVARSERLDERPAGVVAVLDDPWAEPLPELAEALAGIDPDEASWRLPAVSGLAGPQGWSAATGPFTFSDYRRLATRSSGSLRRMTAADAAPWTGFAVAPAGAAAELLERGWPPRRDDLRLAPGVRLFRYGDPADHDRRELDPFLPAGGGLWVDIGCGTGRLGARHARGDRRVVGVEPDAELAAEAATRLAEVVAEPVERALDRLGAPVDCAILADVLEHTVAPAAVLRAIATHLAADGRLVVSFPNAAWAPYARALLAGRWDATLAGGQARDHLVSFTPDSFADLAAECGFEVERLEPLPGELPARLRLWARLAALLAGGRARSLEGAQWVAVLRPRADRRDD